MSKIDEVEVIDPHGARRKERGGYIARDGERVVGVRVAMTAMDGSGGRTFVTDAQPSRGKIGIGDAAIVDSVDGTPRVAFTDGTGAMKRPDGSWVYIDAGGYIAKSHSREQQAHAAKVAGSFGQWVDGYVDGAARQNVAYQGYVDSLNAWRNA